MLVLVVVWSSPLSRLMSKHAYEIESYVCVCVCVYMLVDSRAPLVTVIRFV